MLIENLLKEKELTPRLIRKYILSEITSEIVKIDIVNEPQGKGLAITQADGHVYKYIPDENNKSCDTIEKLKNKVEKLIKFRSSGAVLGWLSQNAILYDGSKRKAKEMTSAS